MSDQSTTEWDWMIRAEVYRYMIDHARAPSLRETGDIVGMPLEAVRETFRRLHRAHALFLEPGTDRIRMLNPFSAVPTSFRVEVDERSYFANCAWDMLAIPAMLGRDARIHARLGAEDTSVLIPVTDGEPRAAREFVVNFSVPFRHWYDDLIHT